MNIINKLKNISLYPLAFLIVSVRSLMAQLQALGKKPVVHFEQGYQGQKILLLALYEKGCLRPDIENLLTVAKQLGMYVFAINTLKVLEPDNLKDKIDCYIERPNYGRDFGSYRTGFLHIYENGWEKQCERLLMLNDSLFYSTRNLAAFLQKMTDTDIEVVGATENYEIEHHLGSFCISIHRNVLQKTTFKKYWKSYVNTNVRPKVIKHGEFKLSATLRRCVTSPYQLTALFNIAWLANYLQENKDIIQRISDFYPVSKFYHTSDFVDWKRPSLKSAAKRLINKCLYIDPSLTNTETNTEAGIEVNTKVKSVYFLDGAEGLTKAFETSVKHSNLVSLQERVLQEIKNDLMECFMVGSQIHHNGILLHYLGMPLIKLDILYRGVFSVEDVEKIANQLSAREANDFRRLIFTKPFGLDTLVGWKRAAFYRGLI